MLLTSILNQLVEGLILTGPVLLIAVGLSATLVTSRAMNVAVGATYALTAIIAVNAIPSFGVAGVVVVCLVLPVLIYLAMDSSIMSVQRKYSRDPEMASFAATVGVSLVLTAVAGMISHSEVLTMPPEFLRLDHVWHAGGVQISASGVVVVGTAAVAMLIFWAVLEKTRIGAQMRATASDAFLARTVGVRPARVIRLGWVVAGLLTGVATFLLLLVQRSAASMSGEAILLLPFAAVIAGGMRSPKGAVIVSLFFGFSSALFTLVTSSGGVQTVFVFGMLFVVLVLRPNGIFGGTRATRDY